MRRLLPPPLTCASPPASPFGCCQAVGYCSFPLSAAHRNTGLCSLMGTPQLLLWQECGVPAVPHPAQVLVVPLQLSPLHIALSTRASHTISVPLAGIAHCPLRALWEVPLKVKVCNLSHSTTQPRSAALPSASTWCFAPAASCHGARSERCPSGHRAGGPGDVCFLRACPA